MKIDINFEPDENGILDDILLEDIGHFGKLNSKEKSYEDIDEVFDNYLEKKLKKGIKNIFAFNIETKLPIVNEYLENAQNSINKSPKNLGKEVPPAINEQKKDNDNDAELVDKAKDKDIEKQNYKDKKGKKEKRKKK